ncbi:FAD-binding oxidoreductase [Actibacterium sp. 188UL27-1]|uniref:NAD(P)/FAD-dependent oxidoreductase n=1 Tax=Actibacterium sp. 188UL27-1 TaxID=2786961 RepID=UPI00195B827F|nr:FAD-binding oxidoreductase [Actibacterium sp. 188UL27-1]MBM7070311.1 FAD-binding oxidoreductase [Actibacterium sp. 188UL27-1]
MMKKSAISLWDSSSAEEDYANEGLPGDEVDVAIVGGGFTGLSTALHCAELGLSTQVMEAKQIGFGGSGRNVGLVNAGVWHPPAKVREKLGDTYGQRFVQRFGDGPEKVFSLIERHQIRCEVTKTGTIHAAHAPAGFVDLKARFKEWERLGAPVQLLNRHEVSQLTGTDAFFGGLLDARAGTVNPMGYCRGLARAARGAGAAITTGVPVTKLQKEGPSWRVDTDKGPVVAKSVVLGTNAYTDDLWPGLRNVFTKIHYFQLATEPLGERVRHILPERQGLWDTGQIMFSLRRDMEDRLIIGSMGTVLGSKDGGLSHRWARKQLKRLFPDLGPVTFEEAWHGQIAMTPDHLPRIHKLDEGLFTSIGYNGRGITTGTLFGEAIARLLTGADPNDLPLPLTDITTVPSAPIMSRLYQTAFTANQILKAI